MVHGIYLLISRGPFSVLVCRQKVNKDLETQLQVVFSQEQMRMCKYCERHIVKLPCTKGNTDVEGCVLCTETSSSAEVQQLLSHRACALG